MTNQETRRLYSVGEVEKTTNEELKAAFPKEWIGQGWGYKADISDFANTPFDTVLYIPEYGYDENDIPIRENIYSKLDFTHIAEDAQLAEELFTEVDWQFPETLMGEWEEEARADVQNENDKET